MRSRCHTHSQMFIENNELAPRDLKGVAHSASCWPRSSPSSSMSALLRTTRTAEPRAAASRSATLGALKITMHKLPLHERAEHTRCYTCISCTSGPPFTQALYCARTQIRRDQNTMPQRSQYLLEGVLNSRGAVAQTRKKKEMYGRQDNKDNRERDVDHNLLAAIPARTEGLCDDRPQLPR